MSRFILVLQIFLKCSLTFLIAFIWLRFIISSVWISGLIAFAITFALEMFFLYFKRKNNHKSTLKLKEKEDAENMFLSILHDKNPLSFFFQLTQTRHSSEKRKGFIIIKHSSHKVILFPYLKISSLTCDNIIDIYKLTLNEKADKIVITCNNYDKECGSFIKNLPVKILLLDKYETYSMLYSEYDFYPEITMTYKKEAKMKFKDLIAYSFNKSRTKGYLLSAFVLFIPSFFIRPNLYYSIVGSILLLFALISFVNPKFNRKKDQTIL